MMVNSMVLNHQTYVHFMMVRDGENSIVMVSCMTSELDFFEASNMFDQ